MGHAVVDVLLVAVLLCMGLAAIWLWRRSRAAERAAVRAAEAQRASEDANARFLRAIENRAEGISFWDAEDRFVMCNAMYRRQSGRSARVLVPGTPFVAYIRESLRSGEIPQAAGREEEWLAERMARHRSGGGPIEVFRGGAWLLLHEELSPDGSTLISATDVTSLKTREDELRRAKSQAEVANEAKSAFLAVMSHELRTPLNAVIGFAELLGSQIFGPLNARQHGYVTDIQTAGRHLLAVINDILDMSKIESGRYEPDESEFDLAAAIEASLAFVRGRALESQIALHAVYPDPTVRLWADQRAIKQVLVNLLSNAIKFTKPGGTVTVDTRADGEDLLIDVRDTGIGIPPEALEAVFEPFQQADAQVTRRYGGSGLGLAISRRLVERHGGTLTLQSQLEVGTVATVRLPGRRLRGSVPATAADTAPAKP
jgi:signal transduction histidine kinase